MSGGAQSLAHSQVVQQYNLFSKRVLFDPERSETKRHLVFASHLCARRLDLGTMGVQTLRSLSDAWHLVRNDPWWWWSEPRLLAAAMVLSFTLIYVLAALCRQRSKSAPLETRLRDAVGAGEVERVRELVASAAAGGQQLDVLPLLCDCIVREHRDWANWAEVLDTDDVEQSHALDKKLAAVAGTLLATPRQRDVAVWQQMLHGAVRYGPLALAETLLHHAPSEALRPLASNGQLLLCAVEYALHAPEVDAYATTMILVLMRHSSPDVPVLDDFTHAVPRAAFRQPATVADIMRVRATLMMLAATTAAAGDAAAWRRHAAIYDVLGLSAGTAAAADGKTGLPPDPPERDLEPYANGHGGGGRGRKGGSSTTTTTTGPTTGLRGRLRSNTTWKPAPGAEKSSFANA